MLSRFTYLCQILVSLGIFDRLTYFGAPALVSFSHTFMDLSLEDEMKTFVLFVSKAFISSILPMWATKDLQKEAQCKILGTGPAEHVQCVSYFYTPLDFCWKSG